MQNLYNDLEKLLKDKPEFVVSGKLNKSRISDAAYQYNETLLKILLGNSSLKKQFFMEVGGATVFKQKDFLNFLKNKDFLPNSFTEFKNQIGLQDERGEYYRENKDVVLVFPFKDCVLEGGQDKEDQKRNEIFYNETLAPDEITRLFDTKALTNFKLYDSKGEHTLTTKSDIDFSKENLIIKGNNLLALHSLKNVKSIAGQVKLIYIDPPYNTGNDSFSYNDRFTHSTWLTFMKNRLEAAKQLLKKEGAIFIQVDDKEMAYIKVLCDEVFGRENFKECISIKNGSESGVNAINVMRGEQLFKVKEHVLYYSRNSAIHRFKPMYLKAISYNDSYRLEVKKVNGKYKVSDIYKDTLTRLFKQDTLRGLTPQQKQLFFAEFQQYCLNNNEFIFALKLDIQKSGDTFKEFAAKNKAKGIVEEYQTSDKRINLVYRGGMLSSLKDRIVKENNEYFYGTLVSDFWWDIGATPSTEGNVELKSGKKPEKLIKRIIEMCTEENDLVLDYHLGSGTTAAVAHKMKRRYIGIEQLDYKENGSEARLKNVIGGDSTGISQTINWQGGGSFVYAELKRYNQQYIDEIEKAKESKQLKKLYEQMKTEAFFRIEIDHSKWNNGEFEKLNLKEQKELLCECLDKNHLYVNLTEMEDAYYKMSKDDISLNKKFYNIS